MRAWCACTWSACCAVGLALWIRDGLPAKQALVASHVAVCCVLTVALPIDRPHDSSGLQSIALIPWIVSALSGVVLASVVRVFTLACGALWLTCRRERVGTLWALVGVWMAFVGLLAVGSNLVWASDSATHSFGPGTETWVDDAVPRWGSPHEPCSRGPRSTRSRRVRRSSSGIPRSTLLSFSCWWRRSPPFRSEAHRSCGRSCSLSASYSRSGSWVCGDWRCYTVALASAPVLEGIFWGNLSLLILVPVALAWRYRDRAWIGGLAVGAAVAAKLFVWPLIVWLLLTRRFRAAAWAAGSGVALLLGAWATIGFDGFRDYPDLLRLLQDVYAERSLSLATVAGGFGASVGVAVAVAAAVGASLLVVAAWVAQRPDGDRRAFSVVVVASVVATPIVWLHYLALLFIPIAIRWPRLAAAWFFGFVVLLAKHLPGIEYVVPEPCCRPADVPKFVWDVNHGIAEPWQALGVMVVVAALVAGLVGYAGAVRATGGEDAR